MASAMASSMANPAQPQAAKPAAAESAADVTALLEKLHDLMTKGVLSKEEFEAKKAEMLKKLV